MLTSEFGGEREVSKIDSVAEGRGWGAGCVWGWVGWEGFVVGLSRGRKERRDSSDGSDSLRDSTSSRGGLVQLSVAGPGSIFISFSTTSNIGWASIGGEEGLVECIECIDWIEISG